MKNEQDEAILIVIKEKLGALINKGDEISRELNIPKEERDKQIWRVIDELLNEAMKTVKRVEDDFSEEEELKKRKNRIRQAIEKYCSENYN